MLCSEDERRPCDINRDAETLIDGRERVFLVGVDVQKHRNPNTVTYSIEESLQELAKLARTAGLQVRWCLLLIITGSRSFEQRNHMQKGRDTLLAPPIMNQDAPCNTLPCILTLSQSGRMWLPQVVGHTFQRLQQADPRTYIGSGKTAELQAAIADLGVQTVIFDDELSPGQQRSLEKALGDGVRLCDRTALILDIFSQRAATREGHLQVHMHFARPDVPLARYVRKCILSLLLAPLFLGILRCNATTSVAGSLSPRSGRSILYHSMVQIYLGFW